MTVVTDDFRRLGKVLRAANEEAAKMKRKLAS
jgi:hypothetical protein